MSASASAGLPEDCRLGFDWRVARRDSNRGTGGWKEDLLVGGEAVLRPNGVVVAPLRCLFLE